MVKSPPRLDPLLTQAIHHRDHPVSEFDLSDPYNQSHYGTHPPSRTPDIIPEVAHSAVMRSQQVEDVPSCDIFPNDNPDHMVAVDSGAEDIELRKLPLFTPNAESSARNGVTRHNDLLDLVPSANSPSTANDASTSVLTSVSLICLMQRSFSGY